jgi:multiple sugar transport system permease protein
VRVTAAGPVEATVARRSDHRRRWAGRRTRKAGTAFVAPAWLLLAAVVIVPLGVAAYASFTNESLVSVAPTRVVGLENYRTQLTAPFWSSLLVTVQIIVLSLAVQIPIGYTLALTLSRRFRGRSVFRAAITLPMLLTPVAVGLMWRFLADPDLGLVRWIASLFDGSAHPNLLGSPAGAIALVVAVNTWINVPFVTLMLLAGLLAIPDELYEAAALDGASRFQMGRYIIVPLLLPVIAVTCVLRVAADYRMFDLVYIVTRGGPGDATRNLSLLAYQQAFQDFNIGRSCAIAVAMAIIALPTYFLLVRVTRP